ncbi:MAG: Holliday junction branch migration protein RuvA [Liquorilactobacillus hordei]|uniref:Holliday junction branch migration complex subunit RuvA n=2 Tax=Liquorilactobacillus hordei TaxID=468911 RepID=A0A0R1MRK1_9LACO|nr:Holliday junction branch migration protein RuvA [Liquorilactobacillus hordei]AUJ29358.1 Holliday junction DNA helicase RuvA [Liquorilactobacillus hordei]KRL07826.1 Holliday junction DNA helicase RuvA [Liquorilactobacillus hordei DSM 19519]MBZ2405388.1 Holliday junction branch migration protein RuvA [Liquorilactobacillus hordei]QYH52078.1 Holliday junction branch migration protein RuvA [Liquorilactobacillus hordei DSM 19519]
MYEYFDGLVTSVTPYYIVVEIQGIGYQVYVANPFRYHADSKKKVYIYQAVRENAITLYGFWNLAEKNLFLKLLNVSGIGPKSALAILANDNHLGLVEAINGENITYLTKFPGVGKKTAQQIILDLKGKLEDLDEQSDFIGQQSLEFKEDATNSNLVEALAALDALGYTKTETKKITKQLKQLNADSTDDYLRAALKLLMHN